MRLFHHFLFGLLLISTQAYSAPLYYTFDGSYRDSYDPSTLEYGSDFYLGQSDTWGDYTNATYSTTWLIDPELQGSITYVGGIGTPIEPNTVGVFSDYESTGYTLDYFYAELVRITGFGVVHEVGGGDHNVYNDHASHDYGLASDDLDPYDSYNFDFVRLSEGSDDDSLNVFCAGIDSLAALAVGTSCIGEATGFGPEYPWYSSISADLMLTSVSESLSPVPVPAAVWLFGTAMIGLVGFGKRRKTA